jgi:SAM-dependent methyltransferase
MNAVKAEYLEGVRVSSAAADDACSVEYRQEFINTELLLSVLEELGRPVKKDDMVLDFGCGEGRMVYAFRKLGYKAFGTDIALPSPEVQVLFEREGLSENEENLLPMIPSGNYRIPYDDDTFDFVISWEVMEHVQDHEQALSEISRVLKPYGCSLHFFPARYHILEPHNHVPLGTLFQGRVYLYFWALMGIRTKSQERLTIREAAEENYNFLKTETKYLSKKHLTRLVCRHFGNVDFVERHFWKHNGGKSGFAYKTLSSLGLRRLTPLAASLLSPFGHRALFFSSHRDGMAR